MKSFILFCMFSFAITSAYAGGSIHQVGYLKDTSKNRIFTLSFSRGVTEKDIMKHAQRLPNTSGRMTSAYYFQQSSRIPSNEITLAGSVFAANNLLYETPGLNKWEYAYLKSFKGTAQFVNCRSTPNNDLCRQK